MNSPFRIAVLFLLFALIGIVLIPRLAIDLLPSPAAYTLEVNYQLPDSPPEIVELLMTSPLENIFSQLSELKNINSVSYYHRGRILLQFDKKADLDFKRFELAALIRQTYPKLPANASYPRISPLRDDQPQSSSPLLIYSLNAPAGSQGIQEVARERLKIPLSQLVGLQAVDVDSRQQMHLVITYQSPKLHQYNIRLADLREALQARYQNKNLGRGSSAAGQLFFFNLPAEPIDLETLRDLPIKALASPGESIAPLGSDSSQKALGWIRLRDLAQVSIEERRPDHYFRVNGLNSVNLLIYAQPGTNRLALSQKVKNQVQQLAEKLPQGFQLIKESDQSEFLGDELHKIYRRTGLSLIILISLMLLVYRNLRHLLLLLASLGVNLCMTGLVLYFLGISLHLYSLAGLTLSFGLIMDNAILMSDHLRYRQNRRIFPALLGASLTTIAALFMIFFLPEEERLNLSDFALIIGINLGISLLVAWFFTPALYHLGLRSSPDPGKHPSPRSIPARRRQIRFFNSYYRGLRFLKPRQAFLNLVLLLALGIPVFLLPSQVAGWTWYNQSLGNETYLEKVRPYVDRILGGSLRLFVQNVYERSGYRQPEATKLFVNAKMPPGTTLEQMNQVIVKVERYLSGVSGLDKYISQVYSGQKARLEITFQENAAYRLLPYQLKSRLIARSLDWGGVDWNIYGVGQGFSNRGGKSLASFRVKMRGYNYEALEAQAKRLASKLLAHKRIQEVNLNERQGYGEELTQEYLLQMDSERSTALRVPASALWEALRQQTAQNFPYQVLPYKGSYYPLVFRAQGARQFSVYQLENQTLSLTAQKAFPARELGALVQEKNNNALHKENRQYLRIVSFEYYGSPRFGSKYLKEVLAQMAREMPPGFRAEQEQYQFGQDQVRRQYGLLFLLLLALYFICAVLFESLRKPFLIILTIPLSFIGLFLTFSWFDFYFDQGGYAAFILLGGLVGNASIFIINDFNNLAQVRNHNKRVAKAVWAKINPILLTTFSTILGLLPFLSEGDTEVFWFSLAVGSIGGLLFSLIAVFVVLPVWMMKRQKN